MTPEKVIAIRDEIKARQEYESRWIDDTGLRWPTDVGYAFDGMDLFIDELLRRWEEE